MHSASQRTNVKQNLQDYNKTGDPRLPGDKASVNRFAVQNRILASKLTSSAKVLLLAILKHAWYGASERGCFASNETLAGETDLSARQVGRLFLELEKAGEITIERTGESKHAYKTIRPTAACLGIETTSEVGHPCLSADDAPRHPGSAPRHPGQESDRGCPTRIELKEREKEEFTGGVASLGEEDEDEPGPRLLPFPTGPAAAAAITPQQGPVPAAKPMPGPPRPRQPVVMQNYNPPTPIEPDPDPVRTAAALAALRRRFPELKPNLSIGDGDDGNGRIDAKATTVPAARTTRRDASPGSGQALRPVAAGLVRRSGL